MKTALLDRRFGTHGGSGKTANNWLVRRGKLWDNPTHIGQGNTFSFIDTFGDVMTGPIEYGTDYSILKDYDLVYLRIRDGSELGPITNLRRTCPEPILIGYCDEWINNYGLTPMSWIAHVAIQLDAITCGFGYPYEKRAFDSMGINNYYHIPYSSDVMHWKKWGPKPLEDKDFLTAGMWHMRSFLAQGRGDRIHGLTMRTMKKLQDKHGIECCFFLNFDGWKLEDSIRSYCNHIGLEIDLLKHMHNYEFNEKLSSCLLFFEEYPCPAHSRATVVSAAVGTPQISTDMNEPSTHCFPDLTVRFGEWGEVEQLANRLITDEEFWTEQRDAGLKNCEYYWYPAFKERIMSLYTELKNKR